MVAETIQKVIPSNRTRLKWLLALTVMATIAWLVSFTGHAHIGQEVSFMAWADFEKWLFMAYGATEVGNKYSHAVLNK